MQKSLRDILLYCFGISSYTNPGNDTNSVGNNNKNPTNIKNKINFHTHFTQTP